MSSGEHFHELIIESHAFVECLDRNTLITSVFAMVVTFGLYARHSVGWQPRGHGVHAIRSAGCHRRKYWDARPHFCRDAGDRAKNVGPRWRRRKRTLIGNVIENLTCIGDVTNLNFWVG